MFGLNKIYILTRIQPRAETFDTLFYYASFDRSLLEEIFLSIWQEAKYVIWNAPNNPTDKEWRENSLKSYIEQFNIIETPFIS